MARAPIDRDEEIRRIQALKATRVRQQIAALSPGERRLHEGTILTYVQALREWEKGLRPYPEPPLFCQARASATTPPSRALAAVYDGSRLPTRDQIRAARRVFGWSQAKLAERARIGRHVVAQIEATSGDMQRNSLALAKIRNALEAAGLELEGLSRQG